MIVIIEFLVVGLLFGSLVKLSRTPKEVKIEKKSLCKKTGIKTICRYWESYMVSVGLIIAALAISYEIEDLDAELRALAFSAEILFYGFFVFTATYLRMTRKNSQ